MNLLKQHRVLSVVKGGEIRENNEHDYYLRFLLSTIIRKYAVALSQETFFRLLFLLPYLGDVEYIRGGA